MGGFTGTFAQAEESKPTPTSEPTAVTIPELTHNDPFIFQVKTGEITGTLGSLSADKDSIFEVSPVDPSITLKDHYLVGVGLNGAISTGSILVGTDETNIETITVNNTVTNSGAIGMGLGGGSNIAEIGGKIVVTSTQEARGLGLSGDNFLASGAKSTLVNFTGKLDVSSTTLDGTAYGIDLEYGTIEKMENAEIKVSSAGSVTGIHIDGGTTTVTIPATDTEPARNVQVPNATIGYMNNITVNVSSTSDKSSVTALNMGQGAGLAFDITNRPNGGYIVKDATVKVTGRAGQLNFATAHLTDELMKVGDKSGIGLISGDFTMISENKGLADNYNASVGYLLGSTLGGTTASVGFSNTNAIDGLKGTSAGFFLDWNNTNMKIIRQEGFAGGATIVGTDYVNGLNLNATKLGVDNSIITHVDDGSAVAVWLNGANLDKGQLLGTLTSSVGKGVAAGLGAGGSNLPGTGLIKQTDRDTTLNIVAGTITATVGEEVVGVEGALTVAVGAQIGNAYGTMLNNSHFRTKFSEATADSEAGAFYGVIKAQLDDVADSSGKLDAQTVVTGILNYGSVDESHFEEDAEGKSIYSTSYGYRLNDTNEAGEVVVDKIRFNATAVEGDAAGVRVSALVYDKQGDGSKKLVGFGNAVQSMVGDTILTTNSTNGRNTTRLIGNITTGGNVLNGVQTAEELSKMAGQRELVFEAGHFTVTSESWNAQDGVTFGSISSSARVEMTDVLTVEEGGGNVAEGLGSKLEINSSTLNFHTQNAKSSSVLVMGDDMSLDLNGAEDGKSLTINVYLQGDEGDYASASPLYFIDARSTENFDASNENITYVLHLDGEVVEQHSRFEIRHDETGVYLFVPEPSTATMSLLALSSLLARRRRRKV